VNPLGDPTQMVVSVLAFLTNIRGGEWQWQPLKLINDKPTITAVNIYPSKVLLSGSLCTHSQTLDKAGKTYQVQPL
jgi:hypothetical protein